MFLFVPLLESFTSLTVLLSPHKLLFAVDEVLIASDPDMSNIKPVLLEQGCTKCGPRAKLGSPKSLV